MFAVVNNELYHHGVKGMKWGVRKKYRSTGLRAAAARRANAKVDKGFDKWKENTKKKETAIELGKRANEARRAYENSKHDKTLKTTYNEVKKQYKKALRANTTYRKGVVRQEVGRDAARKYLSDAKKVKKQLDSDPTNKQLKKKYNELMSKHDVERANARRATDVSTKRMNKIASMKRTMTVTAKAAAATAIVGAGVAAVNKYVLKGNQKITASKVLDFAKRGRDFMGYVY